MDLEIPRDQYGRPLITPVTGGKPVPYTRASTLGRCLSDSTTLTKWKLRQVALGMAKRADLLTAVAAAHDDKKALDQLCQQAMEAAGATAAATMGTAIHQLTAFIDDGIPLPEFTPPLAAQRVGLYTRALAAAQLSPVLVETFVVNDHLRAAGTFDRLLRTPSGATLIADLKTGSAAGNGGGVYPDQSIEWAVQLAVYATGHRYDPTTGNRLPLDDDLDPTRGIIIALPALGGPCRLIGLDLVKGAELADIASCVHSSRKTRQLAETKFTLED